MAYVPMHNSTLQDPVLQRMGDKQTVASSYLAEEVYDDSQRSPRSSRSFIRCIGLLNASVLLFGSIILFGCIALICYLWTADKLSPVWRSIILSG